MRKKIIVLGVFLSMVVLLCTACQEEAYEYVPKGEFYAKTSPCSGDAGVSHVMSFEAEYTTYEGEGDITVPMTVGFGHRPGAGGYSEERKARFYVLYQVMESPWSAENEAVWEKKVEYQDSWFDDKYDSTQPKDRSFLIIPLYGDFYPLYTEKVDILFPKEVQRGYLEMTIVEILEEDGEAREYPSYTWEINFERENGILTLKS